MLAGMTAEQRAELATLLRVLEHSIATAESTGAQEDSA